MDMPPGFGSKMQVDEGASAPSSSSISSPPNSPPQNPNAHSSDTIHVSRPISTSAISGGGVANAASAIPAHPSAATNTSTKATTAAAAAAPEKPKRQRKKKEPQVGPDGKPVAEEKPKKTRKPREPKEKTAGAEKTTTSRSKKVKTEEKPESKPTPDDAPAQSRQSTLTEMVSSFQQPNQPASTMPPHSHLQHLSSSMHHASSPSASRPHSSGQNYDPIRGSTMSSNPPNGTPLAQTSPHVNRASASPAISSLIDPPPTALKTAAPLSTYSPQTTMQQPFVHSHQSPPPSQPVSAFAPHSQQQTSPPVAAAQPVPSTMDGAMDLEPSCELPKKQQVPEIKAPSKSSSSAATPKAAKPTPEPIKGTGSGLLSSSDLFGGPSSSEPSERKGVNIDIQIKLNPAGGNTVNIAQEIVKKYGRDAINPRAAAHREQLLRIAMEQSKFAEGANDDMSVDLMSELEGDSNVEMGGMDDEKSNTGVDGDVKPARKRRKKVEEYDKEDDFIDDTELAWQEQAAVAKDGFFVYSGPLVPEGQQAQIESTNSTRGTRGGRGRGRGSRSTASGSTHASVAEKTTREPASSTRARARGTRGTGAPRKPRITKADRERMEAEKADREQAGRAGASSAGGIGGPSGAPIALAPTPQQSSTTTTTTGTAQQQQSHMQQPQPPQQSYAQPMGSMA